MQLGVEEKGGRGVGEEEGKNERACRRRRRAGRTTWMVLLKLGREEKRAREMYQGILHCTVEIREQGERERGSCLRGGVQAGCYWWSVLFVEVMWV